MCLVFCCAHLSRYVLLITQARSVGVLSSDTVHSVVYLRSCPAVHLERRGYPLKGVSLDPEAETETYQSPDHILAIFFLFLFFFFIVL